MMMMMMVPPKDLLLCSSLHDMLNHECSQQKRFYLSMLKLSILRIVPAYVVIRCDLPGSFLALWPTVRTSLLCLTLQNHVVSSHCLPYHTMCRSCFGERFWHGLKQLLGMIWTLLQYKKPNSRNNNAFFHIKNSISLAITLWSHSYDTVTSYTVERVYSLLSQRLFE